MHNFRTGARSSPEGGGGSRRDFMVRISIHAHSFRDEDKKGSSSRNLRLRHSVHLCFRPRTKVYLRLGGNKHYFLGDTGPEKHFSGTGLDHIFCAGGTNSN